MWAFKTCFGMEHVPGCDPSNYQSYIQRFSNLGRLLYASSQITSDLLDYRDTTGGAPSREISLSLVFTLLGCVNNTANEARIDEIDNLG